MQAGVQGMQDVQDGDKGRGGGGRLDSDAPGKPVCHYFHDLGRRMRSGHREMGKGDAEPVWVWGERDVKACSLGVGKEIMKGGGSKMRSGVVGNNRVLLHRRKGVWG